MSTQNEEHDASPHEDEEQPTAIVFVTWGNSDDKLSQQEWAAFCADMVSFVGTWSRHVFFAGYSSPHMPWQNASASFLIGTDSTRSNVEFIRADLRLMAARWRQEAIAFTVTDMELVGPSAVAQPSDAGQEGLQGSGTPVVPAGADRPS
jgi:hypothetical protein